MVLCLGAQMSADASLAQLDRVTGYEPVGQGFESLPAYHLTGYLIWDNLLNFYVRKKLEQLNATVRRTVAADGLTEANLHLLPAGADANESLPAYQKSRCSIWNICFSFYFPDNFQQ